MSTLHLDCLISISRSSHSWHSRACPRLRPWSCGQANSLPSSGCPLVPHFSTSSSFLSFTSPPHPHTSLPPSLLSADDVYWRLISALRARSQFRHAHTFTLHARFALGRTAVSSCLQASFEPMTPEISALCVYRKLKVNGRTEDRRRKRASNQDDVCAPRAVIPGAWRTTLATCRSRQRLQKRERTSRLLRWRLACASTFLSICRLEK